MALELLYYPGFLKEIELTRFCVCGHACVSVWMCVEIHFKELIHAIVRINKLELYRKGQWAGNPGKISMLTVLRQKYFSENLIFVS